MFAYCRSNPVRRKDVSGTVEEDCLNGDDKGELFETPDGGYSGGPTENSQGSIPQNAKAVVSYVQSHNGSPLPGYKGGRTFHNDGRGGGEILPTGTTYREYDIYPYTPGIDRGVERVVIGADGSAWYTNDHYFTFTQLR